MPLKFCTLCPNEFFARWRNTPDICPDCLLSSMAKVCPECLRPHAMERDPAQLDAFGSVARDVATASAARLLRDPDAFVPPPRSARRAVQLRNPFH